MTRVYSEKTITIYKGFRPVAKDEVPDEFTLENIYSHRKNNPHLRFTSKYLKRGETELVSWRCCMRNLARVEKIVQSGLDPELETKSDVFQDALFLWLERWDEEHSDGADGELAYQFRMRELERKIQHRRMFLENVTSIWDELKNQKDIRGMKSFLGLISEARFQFSDAPTDFLDRIDELTETIRRLVREAK